jgi:hypothetical protein
VRRLAVHGAIAALALTGAIAAPARAAGDTGVVDVSATPGISETEQAMAVDPFDPARVLVGSNQFQPLLAGTTLPGPDGVVDTGVWASADGGRSWHGGQLSGGGFGAFASPIPVSVLPSEFTDVGNAIEADQSEAFDRYGNAYYETGDLYSSGNLGDGVGRVWRSSDGGMTWQAPVIAFRQTGTGELFDRPFIVADDSGGSRDGTLYFAYETAFYTNILNAVFLVTSSDQGQMWTAPVRVDEGSQTQADPRQMPAVGAGGVLYDVYDTAGVQPQAGPQLQPIALTLARSSDGGSTFAHFTVDADAHRLTDPDEAEPYFTEFISALAADPSHPGRLAVAWPEAHGPSTSRIVLRYSLDGGASWSPRIDVAADPAGGNNQHDHVALTYAPDGRLFVVWRDRRCCGGSYGDAFEVYARELTPGAQGGLSLGPELQVSPGPVGPSTNVRGIAPDEYLAAGASGQALDVAWDEIRGTLPDDVFRSVPLADFGGAGAAAPAPCLRSRTYRFRLHHRAGERIVKASVYLDGHLLLARRGRDLPALVIGGLPPGAFRLKIRTVSDRGTRAVSRRSFTACGKSAPTTVVRPGRR